jgi:large subunit ribosomal protein L28
MSRICQICGKGPHTGNSVSRRGLARRKGGAGSKVVKRVKQVQLPNLQTVRTVVNGTPKTLRVCATCLKSGRVARR